tara:strand:+ start:13892 stop:14905 length:1014 start_codon:yes stop_codon:yes gene_type:complete
MTNLSYFFFSFCEKPKSLILLCYFATLLFLGFAMTFLHPPSAFAFFSSKDSKAIHARFDLIESKVDSLVQTLKNLHETALRNQADIKSETIAFQEELTKVHGRTEENNKHFVSLLQKLEEKLQKLEEFNQAHFDELQEAYIEQIQKFKDFNQAYFEEERKKKELFQKSFKFELEEIALKIADLAAIYKTSTQEEIDRENKNIVNFNQKMEEVNARVNQLIKVYKNMAKEQTSSEVGMVAGFNKQLDTVNSKISQLIKIYKQSISTITTSNKKGLVALNKQLASVNTKIQQLAEIYKTSIKENNATLATISKNLSKELQSINTKLSKPKKAKSSKTKK